MPNKHYDTNLSDAAWALVAPLLPSARPGGRPRTTDTRAVVNAIFYLLRTGCQWRLLPGEFPAWGTVYHYFRTWKDMGVWTCLQREIYEQTRLAAGRNPCPSVVIMDGQSVKTTERGGVRGFDSHKQIKGRKRTSWWICWGCPLPVGWNQPTCRTAVRDIACWRVCLLCSRRSARFSPMQDTRAASWPVS